MLKLTASYSKKVPLPDQQFSSQQYHASVEVELPDGLNAEQLEQRTRQTFALVRDSVERELRNGSSPHTGASAPAAAPAAANTGQPVQTGGTGQAGPAARAGNAAKASGKQVKYLLDLAAGRGRGVGDLNREAARRFGVEDIHALSRTQASELINFITGRTPAEGKAA